MRGHGAALATILLLLLIAGVASALPTDPKLGKITAQGPVGLSSSRANVALLQGTGISPVHASLATAGNIPPAYLKGRQSRTYKVTVTFPDTGTPPGPTLGDNA